MEVEKKSRKIKENPKKSAIVRPDLVDVSELTDDKKVCNF
jgi:hypothetical protein